DLWPRALRPVQQPLARDERMRVRLAGQPVGADDEEANVRARRRDALRGGEKDIESALLEIAGRDEADERNPDRNTQRASRCGSRGLVDDGRESAAIDPRVDHRDPLRGETEVLDQRP